MMIKRKKIVFLLRGKTTPSSRHRVLGYLDYLEDSGLEVCAIAVPKNFLRMFVLSYCLFTAKAVVIQKKVLHRWELYFLHILNKHILYDLDDLATERPKDKKDIARNISREKRFWLTVKFSKAIIVGNTFLENYIKERYPSKLIEIIPTPINMEQYHAKENYKSAEIAIGWIGLPGNLLYLDMVKDVLVALSTKYQLNLTIVCSHFIEVDGLKIIEKQWSKAAEIADLKSFDIGIMPLNDDVWSQAKCGFKALQCMGVGVPVVVSPVGINAQIVSDGENGFWAKDSKQWYDKLELLIKDEVLRKSMGQKGRQTVLDHYSLRKCSEQLKALLLEL